MREVLGITKKEFHNGIMDLIKRKRLSTELEPKKPVEVKVAYIKEVVMEEKFPESHYMSPHWARVTTETPCPNPERERAGGAANRPQVKD